ncbi:flavodoxin [Romboutsia weinsteinii]|uniref:Flavodoxin n=1 Tax=Romboutsia weinsteinii TaxID=2020949 RepID=A0A371IY39_9FIRM|nr:hypothetical protein [Romboutsia weinsteinii]RDY25384.1 flavodoxin [Romboutsia weinsteinii]
MNNVAFVNASPRNKNSTSSYLTKELINICNNNIHSKEFFISNIKDYESLFKKLVLFDKLVFVTPLYVDSLPSELIEFMLRFENYIMDKNINNIHIYAIVNCGFLEGHQNHIALDIIKNFTHKCNLQWCYGIGIGGGEFLRNSKSMPLRVLVKKPIYEDLVILSDSLIGNNKHFENLFVNPKLFRTLFIPMANQFWLSEAKKNKLSKKDLLKIYE